MPGKANLTFYVNAGMLSGKLNGKYISFPVVSGGGGGAKGRVFGEDPGAVNNPFRSNQKENAKKKIRGGSIPSGTYRIGIPARQPHLGLAARLTPLKVPELGTRGGFFIHGRGPKGSDGCLVPLDAKNYQLLMAGLKADNGGALSVFGVVDLPQFCGNLWA
jgi:hypothetical protein